MASKQDDETSHEVDDPTVDRGWAWLVALGSFLLFFITLAQSRAMSVLLLDVLEHMDTRISTLTTMFSLETVANCVAAQISANVLLPRFSVRTIAFIATVTNAACTLTFVVFQSYPVFFICQVMKVAAQGTMITNCLALVSAYFLKRRGLAITLTLSGVSVSTMLVPPLTRYLREEYGFRGCYLLLAGLEMQGIVGAMLLRPKEKQRLSVVETDSRLLQNTDKDGMVKEQSSHEECKENDTTLLTDDIKTHLFQGTRSEDFEKTNKNSDVLVSDDKTSTWNRVVCKPVLGFISSLFDISIIKDPMCIITDLALTFLNCGRQGEMYIPSLAKEVGVSSIEASTLLSISGAVNMVARIGFGLLADTKLIKASHIVAFASAVTVALYACIHLYTSYAALVAFAAVVGMFASTYGALTTLVYLEVITVDRLAKLMALSTITTSVFQMISSLLHGQLIESTNSFTSIFLYSAGCYFLGVVILLMLPLVDRCVKKKQDFKQGQERS